MEKSCLLFLHEGGEILSWTKRPLSERVLKLNFGWEKEKGFCFFFFFLIYGLSWFSKEKNLTFEWEEIPFSTRRDFSEVQASLQDWEKWLVGWLVGKSIFPTYKTGLRQVRRWKVTLFQIAFRWRLKIEDWRLKIEDLRKWGTISLSINMIIGWLVSGSTGTI